MKRRVGLWLLCLGVLLPIYTLAVLFWSDLGTSKVVFESWQPEEIEYGSYDPYAVVIKVGAIQFNSLGYEREREIWVVRDGDTSYGHGFDLGLTYTEPTRAEWTQEGVTVFFESGHRIFFPKDSFTGGR